MATFDWSKVTELVIPEGKVIKVSANGTTLWQAVYTINYHCNGKTVSVQYVKGKEYAISSVSELGMTIPTGKHFDCWQLSDSPVSETCMPGDRFIDLLQPGETIDLVAILPWDTFTITFMTGSTVYDTKTVDYNTTVSKPTNPSKTGYTFDDWYTTSSLTTKFNFSTKITMDTTVYAKFNINKYTVKFFDGSTQLYSTTVDYNTAVMIPPTPFKTGYTFNNWYTTSALTNVFDFGTKITKDTNLYAKYTINTYTVTFYNDYDSSVIDTKTVNYNSTVSAPANPSRTHYSFDGWFTTQHGSTKFDFNTKITSNTSIYAQYTGVSYTIVYQPNIDGATDVYGWPDPVLTSVEVPINQEYNSSTKTFGRYHYYFDGWWNHSSRHGNPYTLPANSVSPGTKVLTAHWTIARYQINYSYGGTVRSESYECLKDHTLPSPTSLGFYAPSGQTFSGYRINGNLYHAYDTVRDLGTRKDPATASLEYEFIKYYAFMGATLNNFSSWVINNSPNSQGAGPQYWNIGEIAYLWAYPKSGYAYDGKTSYVCLATHIFGTSDYTFTGTYTATAANVPPTLRSEYVGDEYDISQYAIYVRNNTAGTQRYGYIILDHEISGTEGDHINAFTWRGYCGPGEELYLTTDGDDKTLYIHVVQQSGDSLKHWSQYKYYEKAVLSF